MRRTRTALSRTEGWAGDGRWGTPAGPSEDLSLPAHPAGDTWTMCLNREQPLPRPSVKTVLKPFWLAKRPHCPHNGWKQLFFELEHVKAGSKALKCTRMRNEQCNLCCCGRRGCDSEMVRVGRAELNPV